MTIIIKVFMKMKATPKNFNLGFIVDLPLQKS